MTKAIHIPSIPHYSNKTIAALAAIYAFGANGLAASFSYHQVKFVGI
jgi:hypothetical protein